MPIGFLIEPKANSKASKLQISTFKFLIRFPVIASILSKVSAFEFEKLSIDTTVKFVCCNSSIIV